jgi:sporulation protein YlmC with PRC-barrel domain
MIGEQRDYLRLGLRLLDEQIVDSEGRRCGRVEDVEFDAGAGQAARMIGILCGATAWKRRLPPRLAELIPDDPKGLKRVAWDHVSQSNNEILLDCPERELEAVMEGEGAPLAVSQLIGAQAVDAKGNGLGRICDVIATRPTPPGVKEDDSDHSQERPWELHGLLVGRTGLLQRAGFSPLLQSEMQEGRFPDNYLEWINVGGFDDAGRLTVHRI